jgi:hypothetical protein
MKKRVNYDHMAVTLAIIFKITANALALFHPLQSSTNHR